MYGVLYDNPYNERVGQVVKAGEFANAWSPSDLQPARLVGGSSAMRYIGGADVRMDAEPNAYRPRGAVYVGHSPAPTYIVPYSIVNYPQYNAVELADVDMLRSGMHPPMSAGSMCACGGGAISGGALPLAKQMKKAIKRVGRVAKQAYEEIAPDVALGVERLQGVMKGKGAKKDLKKLGKKFKKGFEAMAKATEYVNPMAMAIKNKGTRKGMMKLGEITNDYILPAVVEAGKPIMDAVAMSASTALTGNPIAGKLATEALWKGMVEDTGYDPRKRQKSEALGKMSGLVGQMGALALKKKLEPAKVVPAKSGSGRPRGRPRKSGGIVAPEDMPVSKYRTLPVDASLPMKKPRGRPRKVAGVGVYEGGAKSGAGSGAKSGGAGKRQARGELIKKLMREKGMKLGEASKYIKEQGLL